MSFSRIWASMNVLQRHLGRREGLAAASISSARKRLQRVCVHLVRTGAMTTRVRNRARPMMIWLVGAWLVPMRLAQEAQHDDDAGEAGQQ